MGEEEEGQVLPGLRTLGKANSASISEKTPILKHLAKPPLVYPVLNFKVWL